MKLTAFIFLITCLQTSATGVAQQTITYSGKDVSLESVFAAIKKQTKFRFFFNSESLTQAERVSIEVKNASVEQVMNLTLKDQPFTYVIKGRTIFIIKKAEEVKSSLQSKVENTGDPVTISGKVTDEQGNPLVGANIRVKGSSIGSITDNLGRFTLANLDANSILEISFVGHESQTFHIKGRSYFTIALGQKQSLLDETVVIAYGSTSRRFTTGNVATVKAVDIEKQPVQNPLLALQGRVPGIEITQLTGLPGGGVTVRIQGRNSIVAGLDPLIVVDGVPYPSELKYGAIDLESIVQGGSPLNFINPADIESIDVLKDADATAIYGSRAANGAILITTKKGKAGRTRLIVNVQQGWGKVTRKVDMMKTRDYLSMRYEALRNDGIPISTLTPNSSNYDLTLWDTTQYTDWQKELIGGTALYTKINTGISGGTPAVQYRIGATYNRQTTVFPGNFDDKSGGLSFNINGASSNQRLKVQLTGNYMYDQNHLPGVDLTRQAVLLEPNAPALYNDNGTLNWATNAAGSSTWINPLAYTINSDFISISKNLVSNATISYQIVPGLQIRSSFGYTNTQSELYLPFRLELNPPEVRITSQRKANFGNRNTSSWIVEPQIQYVGILGKGQIDGLLAASIQKNSFSYLSLTGSGFLTDLLMKTLRAATSTSLGLSNSSFTRFNALFGRLGYNWDNKYLIDLTARRDGSSRFGGKSKFNNFGSVGIGWIFSQEKWLAQGLPFLSFGKLRMSYGITGNDQIDDYRYLSIYLINNPTILYQKSMGLNVNNIPNPYLQWEETRKWQGGVDLGFFQDRLVIGAVYARNRSSNQLVSYVLPTITGFENILKNLPALVENTSFEFTLNTVNIKTKEFSWSSSLNVTIPRNKLVRFPNIELSPYARTFFVGQPLGVLKAAHFGGVNPANGRYLVLDKNNNPTTGFPLPEDQIVYISNLSNYYGGLVNRVTYKGFQLDFLFQFVRRKGQKDLVYFNGSIHPGFFSSGSSNQSVAVLNRWQKAGDDALIGRFTSTSAIGTSMTGIITSSEAWYSNDASYIRLKNVSLSWQVPDRWVKRAKLQNARLSFNGQNLATITNYKGLDPETMSISTLPPLQMWTIGVQMDF